MKKLLTISAFALVLFLAACSNEMSGETTTVCRNANSYAISIVDDAVVTLEGMDENILTWTERITMSRDDYADYFWGVDLTDEDIQEIFDVYSIPIDGESWHLISLNESTLEFDVVFNYEDTPLSVLNTRWNTSDFENDVTLSSAIAGLEYYGDANCRTD